MTLTAGALSQVSVAATTAQVASAAATGGTGPYTYQWYRDTSSSGFTPAGGNLIAGATALTLNDSGLVPNVIYYYKVKVTDTGNSNVTDDSDPLTVTTTAPSLSQNQFAQSSYLGVVDLRLCLNTVSVQIDATQATALYAGSPVKIVDSAGGVPKVIGIAAESDSVLGFLNYSTKNQTYVAGDAAEMSMSGNVITLYSAGAIARGAQVTWNLLGNGVVSAAGNTGDTIVGWAYDKATAAGQLIRVFVKTPSFTVV